MAYQEPQGPRDPNKRPQLQFSANERGLNAESGRAFPTTPSTFPQPVYSAQNGQQEVWGAQQQPPSQFPGGPPSYFVQHVNVQQPNYQPNQGGYKSPAGGYNDGTNGLVHQFSHQNLGAASTPRSASPYGRTGTPTSGRPKTPSGHNPQQPHQYGSLLANPYFPGQNGLQEEELPPKNPDQYGDNVYRRTKHSTELVGTFFRDNVTRAKERNQR